MNGDLDARFPRLLIHAFGVNEEPVWNDVKRMIFVEPHVPVDPRSLVPPAFRIIRIHAYDDHVQLVAEIRDVADVDGEGRVAAEVAVKQMAVDVHRAMGRDAVEAQGEVTALVTFLKAKMPPVPRDPPRQKPLAHMVVRSE